MDRKERKKYKEVMESGEEQVKDTRLFDHDEEELKVSEVKNGTFTKRLKLKLADDFTSRKFTMLLLAVFFFINRPENFTADHLIYAMIIYAAGNAADKLLGNLNRQQ